MVLYIEMQAIYTRLRNASNIYDNCPRISNTKVCYKMAYSNSADPDQTAPEGAVWSGQDLQCSQFQ